MSSGGHPPHQLAASFIHRAVATDQRAPIQLQSHLLPCRQGQRCRLRFVATGPLQAGQRRALVAFETGPEIWFRAARGMAQKKRPQSATTGAAAYTRQHRGMDWQAHGQGPARGIVPSPVNLGMLCADRSPPGDCIVRAHPSAAALFSLAALCFWWFPSKTRVTLSRREWQKGQVPNALEIPNQSRQVDYR
jgi:hypothetical protein